MKELSVIEEYTEGLSMRDSFRNAIHTQMENKIYRYTQMNIPYTVVRDDDGFILQVLDKVDDTASIEDNSTDTEVELWNGVELNPNFDVPVPSHCLNVKQFCAKEYCALLVLSNRAVGDGYRYLYRNKINITELSQSLGINKATLDRNIKKLGALECNVLSIENSKDGIVYKLNYGITDENGKVNMFITINHLILKELVCKYSTPSIKIYCILKYAANEESFTTITEKWICGQLGLSTKSGKNLEDIRKTLESFEKDNLIVVNKTNIFRWDEKRKRQIPQATKQYRLCSLEEWQKHNNITKDTQESIS